MYIVCNERKWHREYLIFKSTFVFHLDTGEKIKIWQNIKSGKKPLRMNRLKVTMSVLLIILSEINFLFCRMILLKAVICTILAKYSNIHLYFI